MVVMLIFFKVTQEIRNVALRPGLEWHVRRRLARTPGSLPYKGTSHAELNKQKRCKSMVLGTHISLHVEPEEAVVFAVPRAVYEPAKV
jgi:hypothetical protein